MDNRTSLIEIGFETIGAWSLNEDKLALVIDQLANASPVLYAFIIDNEIKYVGKTTRTLKQRLYGYQNPGQTQATNIRVGANIRAYLSSGSSVKIMAYHDKNPIRIGQFQLNRPAGLEDDIIRQLNPEWNGNDERKETIKPDPTKTKSAKPDQTVSSPPGVRSESFEQDNGFLKPIFKVTIGKTYYRQGFFNVPVDFARYFGRHGEEIEIYGNVSLQAKINRKVNSNDTPRIMGGTVLRNWFQSKLHQGENINVRIDAPNHIRVSKD